jgi:hypothetical protein
VWFSDSADRRSRQGLRVNGLDRRRSGAAPLGRTGWRALTLLPPHVQAAVRESLHAQHEKSTQATSSLEQGSAAAALKPPYLFVVKKGQSPTFTSLRELAWVRPDLVGVVFDRRWMGQRRTQNHPTSTERRRAARRRAAPDWTKSGFVLTAPTRAPAFGMAPRPAEPPPTRATPAVPAIPSPTVVPPHPTVAPQRTVLASPGSRRRRRVVAFGVGFGVLLAAASAAGVYLRWQDLGPSVEWLDPSAKRIQVILSSSLASALSIVPGAPGRPEPVSAPAPPRPAASRPELRSPAPPAPQPPAASRAALPASPAPPPADSGPAPPADAESAASTGVAADQCVAPTVPTMAVQGGEVLGALVNVKIDANAQSPRCLFVVERQDGTLWVVDSSRVEARPQ